MAKVIQTFLAVGGPLNGLSVTEQYAGPEYTRFNNASGIEYSYETVVLPSGRAFLKRTRDVIMPKCLLIHKPTIRGMLVEPK